MSSVLDYTVVDAFTSSTFSGNPAAVIVLDPSQSLPERILQLIAREFNLSETAFLIPTPLSDPSSKADPIFGLRWFTPNTEVPLCGHATLASAHVLFHSTTHLSPGVNTIRFETLSGVLSAKRLDGGKIELEFPGRSPVNADPPFEQKVRRIVGRVLGEQAEKAVKFVGVGGMQPFDHQVIIELDSSIDLESLSPSPQAFMELAPSHWLISITSASRSAGRSFISRVFAPATGVPEDPVTGSAHCMLGPYWHQRLGLPEASDLDSEVVMKARQASERGGDLEVVWNEHSGRCKLRGHAVIAASGQLVLP